MEEEKNCSHCSPKKKLRSDEEKKMLLTRTRKIAGQMNGIARMIEEDRYCDDILIQLSAIDKSIKSLANVILENHMNTCLVENIQNGNTQIVGEIVDLFKRFQ
ncbi:MAG: metal-sensing transcriptional repressor [Clostridia bacterium]|nr:metal-sensing transcriptional repressor [Clostridia bacterium]